MQTLRCVSLRVTLLIACFLTWSFYSHGETTEEEALPAPVEVSDSPVEDSPAEQPANVQEAIDAGDPMRLQEDVLNAAKEEFSEPAVKVKRTAREIRIQHARELLGKFYRSSSVKSALNVKESKIKKLVFRLVREHLPEEYRRDAKRLAKAILAESVKHDFDPIFLLSVIQNESSFRPDQLGSLDEIGLMQLRPSTARWIAKMNGLKWKGVQSLFDPVTNIQIGAYYLSYLRGKFDSHARLYLAAYNMGAKSVGLALGKNVWPKDYPSHVMRYYVEFYAQLDPSKKADGKSI